MNTSDRCDIAGEHLRKPDSVLFPSDRQNGRLASASPRVPTFWKSLTGVMQRPQARDCCPCLGREEEEATQAHSNKGFISLSSTAISAFLPARLNFRLSLERPGWVWGHSLLVSQWIQPWTVRGRAKARPSSVLRGLLRPPWVSGSHCRVGCLLATVVTAPGSLGTLGVHQHEGPREHPTCRDRGPVRWEGLGPAP